MKISRIRTFTGGRPAVSVWADWRQAQDNVVCAVGFDLNKKDCIKSNRLPLK
jgi:hypothetical protein